MSVTRLFLAPISSRYISYAASAISFSCLDLLAKFCIAIGNISLPAVAATSRNPPKPVRLVLPLIKDKPNCINIIVFIILLSSPIKDISSALVSSILVISISGSSATTAPVKSYVSTPSFTCSTLYPETSGGAP